MAAILITGGTGMIGTELTKELINRGHDVIILTRRIPGKKKEKGISYAEWDLDKQFIEHNSIGQADFIVHLAGANVGEHRWTNERKKEILDSRVKSGELIVKALKEIPNKVKAVVSASGIGYYGNDSQIPNPKPFVETDAPANDFLGKVVQQWERAIEPVKELGKRLVILRTGLVLSKQGGVYAEFKKPLQFGIAPILGNGKQMISWISIDDIVRAYVEAIEYETWNGIYNAATPTAVSNKELIMQIARQQKIFIPFSVPAFVLKTVLGEMSVEVLKSTTVDNHKIQQQGFVFLHPNLEAAIQKLEAS